MKQVSFAKIAGWSAIGTAAGGIAYAIAFVIFLHDGARAAKITNSALLLLGGVGTAVVLVALYQLLRDHDHAWALGGLLVGIAGSFASSLHGGTDLALAVRHLHETNVRQTDPRGLATFAFVAASVAVFSWLMRRDPRFSPVLSTLGLIAAAGLMFLYLGRIGLYDPNRPILLALLVLMGFVINPAWYVWVGLRLKAL
jgi:hypothetical protein